VANKVDTVVVADANVLINLILIDQLPLLGRLDGYRFLVPSEVAFEITDRDQRQALGEALAAGYLEEVIIDTMQALERFSELRDMMGKGEAACLALASTIGAHIASDEKKRFRRSAIELIGEQRVMRTEGLLLAAIRQGCISVTEADVFKERLASKRYAMPFSSFSDLL
jgi:predicted nucleic acid-binding protein